MLSKTCKGVHSNYKKNILFHRRLKCKTSNLKKIVNLNFSFISQNCSECVFLHKTNELIQNDSVFPEKLCVWSYDILHLWHRMFYTLQAIN